MIAGQQADRTAQLADMVMKTEAALGEPHHCRRFGHHLRLFPQKSYFLLSHCAHLLLSRQFFACLGDCGLFEEKLARRNQKDLKPMLPRYA